MKLLFLLGNISLRGGSERAAFTVGNLLAKAGFDVHLLGISGSQQAPAYPIIEDNVSLRSLNVKPGVGLKIHFVSIIRKIKEYLAKEEIDILVSVEVMNMLFALPAYFLMKKKPKLVSWEHFNFTVNLGKNLRDRCRKWSAKYADSIIVLTQKDVELWQQKLKIKGNIWAINNPSPFAIGTNSYSGRSKNIIAVGRLTYQKGFDRLIDIWSDFLKINNQWKLQIIGSGQDEEALKKKVAEKNLKPENIEFVPSTENIGAYYESASFLVMTSRFEGLPMTLIEAQSYGLPVIAYDCLTGPAEVITEQSGIVVPDGQSNLFVKALSCLTENGELREKMSRAAKNEALRFEENEIVQQWIKLLKSI